MGTLSSSEFDPVALLKVKLVLRILNGLTTVEQEAGRLQIDSATVGAWLEWTRRTLSRATDEDPVLSLYSRSGTRESASRGSTCDSQVL